MNLDFLCDVFQEQRDREALIWRDRSFTYADLLARVNDWQRELTARIPPGPATVSLEADFSPNALALFLALLARDAVIMPLAGASLPKGDEFCELAEVQHRIRLDANDASVFTHTGANPSHPLLQTLFERVHPGLVLFSSGSTGKAKGAVHDAAPLLDKFRVRRRSFRSLAFLLFDHIGGINTLLYSLSNGGCIVTVENRSPESVCAAIERHKVEVLPASPTFLNLLLISETYKLHDLSSLRLVTYGTEVMPETVLERFVKTFPGVELLQTYGLSELGILRSRSKSSDSLWVKLGGEGFETRVVDGMLEIKAKSAMLGYLNHESPFTSDGWFRTGDSVLVDGEYFRVLGRKSEMINVGGEKVFPAEVESLLQQMDGVAEVSVRGETSLLTGQLVAARVRLSTPESVSVFRARMRNFLKGQVPSYKIPQKVELVNDALVTDRFKKAR